MDWFLAFLISVTFNVFALGEFWVFWRLAVKQYEGLRNFFMRNFGYGFLLIRYPEGRIEKVFTKLKEKMQIDKEIYLLKSERVYRFEGLPALLYNKGNCMPINMQNLKSDELFNNAEFLDNIYTNTKIAAEAEAEAKNGLKELLLWISLGLTFLCLCAVGYLIYLLTGGDVSSSSIITTNV
jgi:hypothetical protein